MRLANISNGLPFEHDGTCWFQSQHGHHLRDGYFRADAMPWDAVIHLLRGGSVEIIDATQHNKPLSDALRYGVPTWAMVFNRAVRLWPPAGTLVCEWQTREMRMAAFDTRHKKTVRSIRRLAGIYGASQPAVIGVNVLLTCHRNIAWDDKPELIRTKLPIAA